MLKSYRSVFEECHLSKDNGNTDENLGRVVHESA